MLDRYFLKPSRIYSLSLVIAPLLAITSVFLANIEGVVQFLLVMLVALGIFPALWREALLRHATSWQSIILQQRHVRIIRRNADEVSGEVMHRTLVMPLCIVLWVRTEGGVSVSQVIFPDALQDDAFRELCVRLKHC